MPYRWIVLLAAIVLLALPAFAGDAPFDKTSSDGELLQQGDAAPWCPVCGMNLRMFYKTNHAARFADGTVRQYCSLHCLVEDLAARDEKPKEILAVDALSGTLISAKRATYVVDSDVPGTMTRVSKLAFAKKSDAAAFAKAHGGDVVKFKRAYELAKEQWEYDAKRLRAKKAVKMHPAGEKIFSAKCEGEVDPSKYATIADLKAALKADACKGLREKPLQMAALYLWDVKRVEAMKPLPIEVDENEKCPVCGMFVAKYPHWVGRIEVTGKGHVYFDGAKDLFKFHLEPSKYGKYAKDDLGEVLVTDYYTLGGIDAKQARYVIGSDVLGPMGHELIPFASKESAETFLKDHGGKKILTFGEVTLELLLDLDQRK